MSINLGEEKVSSVLKVEGGTGGTSDYVDLDNKPSINGVELVGDKTSSDLGLETQQIDAYTKDETNAVIASAITGKADINYVDNQLNLKADKVNTYTKTEVDNAINSASTNLNNKLNNKADKTSVYTKEELPNVIATNTVNKADTSYVNEQLALKADKSNTYTKKEIDEKLDNPTITGDTLPVGSVVEWTGTQTPQGWLLCDGREVSRTTYSELFAAIGTVWGAGDGSTSFNIPDYRDKFVLGAGREVDLAETGGEKEVTLTLDEVPPHYHFLNNNGNDDTRLTMNAAHTGGNNYNVFMDSATSTELGPYIKTNNSGGGQSHNNMPPYVGTYYIIKAKQSAGVVATVVDNLSSTSTTDALSAKQGKILNDKFYPSTLYYNQNGSSDNIVLSDDVKNYDYIEVTVRQENYTQSEQTQKLSNPNNRKIHFNFIRYEHTDVERVQIFGANLTFSGKNVTYSDGFGYVLGDLHESTVANSIKIIRIF